MPERRVTATPRILLVDDDRAFRVSTSALLREEGYVVEETGSGREAVEALKEGSFDLILLDLRMPEVDGIQLVEILRRWGEGVPILMVSGFGTVEKAVEALHTGADDFLTKPVEPDVLTGKVAGILERCPSVDEEGGDLSRERRLVGRSRAMREVRRAVEKVAPSDATVLIQGETGTGKELAARGIHEASDRRDGPFIPVNCAALSEGLLESELFGHVKGAFTGAVRDKEGLFMAADGGTLFLDEIGGVSPALQHRLLRVLQEKELTPVGEVRPRTVDARVLAATNRELKEEVRSGAFREDLYYRLNVFRLEMPPLRERASDIPLLVEHFFRIREMEAPPRISPLAMRLLQAYPWPGNVRQLFAVLQSALIRTEEGRPLEAQHLPEEIREWRREGGGGPSDEGAAGDSRYAQPDSPEEEREAILAALEETGGVKSRAARMLGMGRTTLWRKMKEYGIEVEE